MDNMIKYVHRQISRIGLKNFNYVEEEKLPRIGGARVIFAYKDININKFVNIICIYENFNSAHDELVDRLVNGGSYVILICGGDEDNYQDMIHEYEVRSSCRLLVLFYKKTMGSRRLFMELSNNIVRFSLYDVVKNLSSGNLYWDGPNPGYQTVGIELLNGPCWKCEKNFSAVTGIVFPDRPVSDWSSPDWLYYYQNLRIAVIDGMFAVSLSVEVEKIKENHPEISSISKRWSRTTKTRYWAAECPHCRAMQGDFPSIERRMGVLVNGDARKSGKLMYYPWTCNIPPAAAIAVMDGGETCEYSCDINGWRLPVSNLSFYERILCR